MFIIVILFHIDMEGYKKRFKNVSAMKFYWLSNMNFVVLVKLRNITKLIKYQTHRVQFYACYVYVE